ncbi:hypothetical protein HDU84_000455 [Entophlyctis sp. JEL0112]|nr:hypothetical protein HDU84_000455 [Entophlyctis sp. JEL0112]
MDIKNVLNFAIFVPQKSSGSQGYYLNDQTTLESCGLEQNVQVEFCMRKRNLPPKLEKVSDSDALPTPKNQKRFMEDLNKGLVDKVRDRCIKGFDPNFETETGETPLCAAVLMEDVALLAVLLDNGASMDYRCSEKHHSLAPLHCAIANNKLFLIQRDSWIEIPDSVGRTPIFYAVSGNNPELVSRLLDMKANASYVDESGKSLLHMACMNNMGAIVGLLIDYGRLDIEAINVAGNTPLHITATRNAADCAQKLLIRGADKNKTNKFGNTVLQMAVLSGSTEVVDLINSFSSEQIVPPPPGPDELLSAETNDYAKKRASQDSETSTIEFAIQRKPAKRLPQPPKEPLHILTTQLSLSPTTPTTTSHQSSATSSEEKPAEPRALTSTVSVDPISLPVNRSENNIIRPVSEHNISSDRFRNGGVSMLSLIKSPSTDLQNDQQTLRTINLSSSGSQEGFLTEFMQLPNLSLVAGGASVDFDSVAELSSALSQLKQLVNEGIKEKANEILNELDSVSARCTALEKELKSVVTKLS